MVRYVFTFLRRKPPNFTSTTLLTLLGIIACQHHFEVLAMSSDTPAAAALILVPIVIVASAAAVALKTSHLYKGISRILGRFWEKNFSKQPHKRRKLRRSNLSSSQTYADSWLDLESNAGDEPRLDTFINQTPIRSNNASEPDTISRIWHPNRDARLTWSFANPNHFESSSVVRPLPVAQPPERLSTEDVEHLMALKRVEAAHQ
jgi:hypothetical protein